MGRLSGARIAVIGGGPAGAIAAARLRVRGAVVALYHREPRGGRGKPCGGGVLPRAFSLSAEIASPRCPHVDVASLEIRSPRGRRAVIEAPLLFRVFRRSDLDAALRDAARSTGVTIVDRAVTDVAAGRGGVEIACGGESDLASPAVRARFDRVVGADGVRSLVRRRLSRPFPDEDLMRAVGYEVVEAGAEGPPRALVAFERGLRGYLWVFPRPGGASIGACGDAATTPHGDLRRRLDRFLDSGAGRSFSRRGERHLTSWFIPALRADSLDWREVEGDGFALVGDAAGTADPITAEGIRPAIESAEALARAWDAGTSFRDELSRALGPPLRAAAALKDLFYSAPALETLAFLASRSATLRALLADLVRGEASTDDAGSRLRRDLLSIAAEALFPALSAPSSTPVGDDR